jgi:hypothetical protein
VDGSSPFNLGLVVVSTENAERKRSASLQRQHVQSPGGHHLEPGGAIAAPYKVLEQKGELNFLPERH